MNFFVKLWRFLVDRLVGILVFVLALLLVLFVAVVFWESAEKHTCQLLGVAPGAKYTLLTSLGIGMGGILFVLQVLASHRRARAMEDAAKAQADATKEQAKANQHTEQGQRQERLKNAIEHLGHKSVSARLGGTYELFHLAQDTQDLRQTILDISAPFCAHIRRTTSEDEYRKTHRAKPSEEIQSLLTSLFVQRHEVFKGLRVNLQGSWLNGANLWEARLVGADLTEAHLPAAFLLNAQLQGALLRAAHLQLADLRDARLQGAILH